MFTGQRAEGFYVDLGAIFDLGILRPFLEAHLAHMPAAPGINATKAKNIHTIAIQVPITDLTADGNRPTNVEREDRGARRVRGGQPAARADLSQRRHRPATPDRGSRSRARATR